MDRRQFLMTGSAAAGVALLPTALFAQGAADAAVSALFERIFQTIVANSPELATSLGLDRGPLAGLKGQLTPATAEERARDLARTQASLKDLRAVDRAALSPAQQNNLDVVIYLADQQSVAPARFDLDSTVRPYPIFQQGGAYFSTPDFLNTAHTIRGAADAEAYLSRLEAFATVLDQETEEQRAQAARGFLAPGWSLDLTLVQMRKLRGAAAGQSGMVQSLVTRAKAANLAGDWGTRATRIVGRAAVWPAPYGAGR